VYHVGAPAADGVADSVQLADPRLQPRFHKGDRKVRQCVGQPGIRSVHQHDVVTARDLLADQHGQAGGDAIDAGMALNVCDFQL